MTTIVCGGHDTDNAEENKLKQTAAKSPEEHRAMAVFLSLFQTWYIPNPILQRYDVSR